MTIEYQKNDYGYEFPIYNGKLLSWSLETTQEDEEKGFPKLRTVINAMIEKRPEQLGRERYEMVRASFDRIFGHNAKKIVKVIDEEMEKKLKPRTEKKNWTEE